jgi:hypothetical protein
MAPVLRRPGFRWRAAVVALAMACLFALADLVGFSPAQAQDTANSGNTFWLQEQSRLQRQRPATARQAQRIRRLMPHRQLARPTIWHERPAASPEPDATPVEPAQPNAPPTDTANAPANPSLPADAAGAAPTETAAAPPPAKPFVVGVIGDNLAQWLATGLTEAFPPGQPITIVSKTRESSGLVRDDFFDWPKGMRDFVAANHLDAIVVMMGSNDRQPLRGDGGATLEPLTAAWEAAYDKKIDALLAPAKEKSLSVVWVGMPIMKSEKFSLDIGAINEIDRSRAEVAGARFVDIYDAFADEKGQYSPFGPDVNGQIVKLRTGDGIHFTRPGARKLAHFVEADIRRLYEAARPKPDAQVAALPPPTAAPAAAPPTSPSVLSPQPGGATVLITPAPPPKPEAGPVMALTAAPISPNGDLVGGTRGEIKRGEADRAAVETLLAKPPAGRIDDFSWPRR